MTVSVSRTCGSPTKIHFTFSSVMLGCERQYSTRGEIPICRGGKVVNMDSDNTSKNNQAEIIPKDCNEKVVDSVMDVSQILDDINRRIKAAECLLNEQRVNATILTVELATLHDPLMRETLALCTQASTVVEQEISKSMKTQDHISQVVQSFTLQDHGKPQEMHELQLEGQHSLLSDTSQMIVDQDQNALQSKGFQPPLMLDSHGIQTNLKKHHSNLRDKGSSPNTFISLDSSSEDINDHVCQSASADIEITEYKSVLNSAPGMDIMECSKDELQVVHQALKEKIN